MGRTGRRLFVATLALVVLDLGGFAVPAGASVVVGIRRDLAGVGIKAPQGRRFSSADATWVVPTAACSGVRYSDAMVGVGLDSGRNSHPLAEIGSGVLCWHGVAHHYLWSETIPGTGLFGRWWHLRHLFGQHRHPVQPGDTVTASVTANFVGGPLPAASAPGATGGGVVQSYDFAIDIVRPDGSRHSTTFHRGAPKRDVGGLRADCVVRAATLLGKLELVRLTRFSPVRFSHCAAREDGSGTVHSFNRGAEAVVRWVLFGLHPARVRALTRVNGPYFKANPNGLTVRWVSP